MPSSSAPVLPTFWCFSTSTAGSATGASSARTAQARGQELHSQRERELLDLAGVAPDAEISRSIGRR
jgi:hypothetical protein